MSSTLLGDDDSGGCPCAHLCSCVSVVEQCDTSAALGLGQCEINVAAVAGIVVGVIVGLVCLCCLCCRGCGGGRGSGGGTTVVSRSSASASQAIAVNVSAPQQFMTPTYMHAAPAYSSKHEGRGERTPLLGKSTGECHCYSAVPPQLF